VRNPIGNLNINVKALYAGLKGYTGGLARIAEDMKIPFEGTHHRGVDDSRMVAKIYKKLLST
jgi:inhibitor of KinA sporulation pathway (predicted exonuclease)